LQLLKHLSISARAASSNKFEVHQNFVTFTTRVNRLPKMVLYVRI